MKEEVLGKAIYDVLKYIVVLLLTYFAISFVPFLSSINSFIKSDITVSIQNLLLIVLSVVLVTIVVYFVFNRKKLRIINHDLRTDELTLLNNQRALSADLPKAIEWSKSENKQMSVIIIDIDDFKKFNSDYSQQIADIVLKKFAEFLLSDSRITDTVYRQHVKGDEFVIIAKNTNLNNAIIAANRKRLAIASTGIKIDPSNRVFKITVCCGVAELNKSDNAESILKRAFSAMLQAKSKQGKNGTASLI